ncbi:MAG TPA: 1-deoxy-D-xylulose-5-phosphate synthase [bacterium]|nr:1-deoxy-D-xylulose-5-phosphate synthase [bacterium]
MPNSDTTGRGGGKILDRVREPFELRKLDIKDLAPLAQEVRETILSAICETGGHLASSFGVVELTIAIHYVFNTPDDRLIWDVGHQTYPHKVLTGRRDQFSSIRCYGGLSGFPKRGESPYDSFGTGHASTSISAAMGMAQAFKLAGKPNHVVAVIGDGGLTGGMALEALNQTPGDLANLTVVLNDNEMSIAKSVGQLSTFLSRAVVSKPASRVVKMLRRMAKPLPERIYQEMSGLGQRWRKSFLTFWTPGALFESLGYHYIGPVDGHDIEQLVRELKHAREVEEPVLIHVLTTKGKGYPYAEENPSTFHGIGPFDPATGERLTKSGPPTYTQVFSDTMMELFERDPRLIGITAAMPQGTGLDALEEAYPGRVFDMGITEQHCVTFAAGMACEGYRPVAAIYSTFLQRAYDQLIHDVCLQNLPVIFALDRAGIVGEDGPTHHGLFDISYLRSMPNMSIMSPADENEFRHMLLTATQRNNGPVAIRYPRARGIGVSMDRELKTLPWGKAELRKKGKDLVIIALGVTVAAAEKAAGLLSRQGIDAAVINARFAKPLDLGLILDEAAETGRVVTVEENVIAGGFGSAVLEAIQDAGLEHVAVKRLGAPDAFVGHGAIEQLRKDCGLDPDSIAAACRELVRAGELTPRSAIPR